MKSYGTYFFLMFLIFCSSKINAQTPGAKPLLEYTWENDFLNIAGKGTDKYYSGGIRLGLWYKNKNNKTHLLDKPLLHFAPDASTIYNWHVMQTVFTPEDIRRDYMNMNDWPYAAGLFVSHGVFSVNTKKNLALKSELILGVLGPKAYGGETQAWIHKQIHYVEPQGWAHQINNTPIMNYHVALQPKLYSNKHLDVFGNIETNIGTLLDKSGTGVTLRFGKLNNYFLPSKESQMFVTYSFNSNWVFYNAYLQGSLFDKSSAIDLERKQFKLSRTEVNNFFFENKLTFNFIFQNFSFVYSQTYESPQTKHTEEHSFGALSFFFKLWIIN